MIHKKGDWSCRIMSLLASISQRLYSGPIALSCRPGCSFRPLSFRKRRGFSNPMLSDVGADCEAVTATAATVRTVFAGLSYDRGSPFLASRSEQLMRGIGPKIPFNHQLPILECSLPTSAALTGSVTELLRVNAVVMFSIAAHFHVPMRVGWTPYFLGNSACVISSRIASSATLALNSGEWFFRFFILDHCYRHAIHLRCMIPWFDGVICSLNGRKHDGTDTSRLRHDHARRQSSNTAIHWLTGLCVA